MSSNIDMCFYWGGYVLIMTSSASSYNTCLIKLILTGWLHQVKAVPLWRRNVADAAKDEKDERWLIIIG